MLTIVLGGLLGALIGYKIVKANDRLDAQFHAIGLSSIGLAFGVVLAIVIGAMAPRTFQKASNRLASLQIGNGSLSYILRTGSLQANEGNYFFYQKNDDGTIIERVVKVSDSILHESQDNSGMVETHKMKSDSTWSLFGLVDKEEKYHFFLPAGSVIHLATTNNLAR